MKALPFVGRALLSAFIATILLLPTLHGAGEDDIVTIYFNGNISADGGPDEGTFELTIPEGKTASNPATYARTQISSGHGYNEFATEWKDLRVEVGRIYHVSVTTTHVSAGGTFNVKAPPGYTLERINQSGPYANGGSYSFRIMPTAGAGAARRAGEAERLVSGRISWAVSLGALSNGASAGSLQLIDVGWESSWSGAFGSLGLKVISPLPVYNTPGGTSSPFVVDAPRQIKAPEALVDIYAISTTEYELRFYAPSDYSGSAYPYTFTGSPYLVYNIKKPGSSSTELQITKTTSARTEITSIARSGTWPEYSWTVNDWNKHDQTQLIRTVDAWDDVSVTSSTNYSYTSTVDLRRLDTSPVEKAAESQRTLSYFPWGDAPTSVRTGPAGDSLTTSYTYYTNDADPDSYSRTKTVVYPSDAWEAYEYFGPGENSMTDGGFRVHRPYLNSPASPPSDEDLPSSTDGEVTTYWFAPRWTSTIDVRPLRLAKMERKINTDSGPILMAKTEFVYYDPTNLTTFTANSSPLVRVNRYDSTDSSTQLKTVTRYYHSTMNKLLDDQVFSIERPDKTKSVYAYHTGTWSSSGNGTFTPGSGSDTRVAILHGTTDSAGSSLSSYGPSGSVYSLVSSGDTETDVFKVVTGKSTLEATIRDARARVVRRETRVWDGSVWQLVTYENLTYDTAGFLTGRTSNNGSTYSATYNGELKSEETDPTGVVITYGTNYDAAGRATQSTRSGAGGSPDPVPAVTTTYGYDAAGRITSQTVGSSPSATTTRLFDTAGRVTSESAPGPNGSAITTGYAYASLDSGYKRTITLPNEEQRVEIFYPDGHLVSSVTSTDDGVNARHFDYSVDSGRHKRVVHVGSSDNVRKVESWTDWLGRTVQTSRPGFSVTSQGAMDETFEYNSTTGQLDRSTRTGYAATRYEYDGMGRLYRSGLDISASTPAELTPDSLDRFIETETTIEPFDEDWWLKETTSTFFTDSNTTKTRLSTVRTRLTDFSSVTNLQSETRFWDGDYDDTSTTSQASRQLVTVDRSAKTVTETTQSAGVSTDAVRTVLNGRVRTEHGHDNVTYTHTYDGLLRRVKTNNPRSGTGDTLISYKAGTGLVYQVTSPASTVVEYEYDDIGRVTAFLPESGKRVRTAYDELGRVKQQWGDATSPVEYSYHTTYGDPTTIKTYQAGSGWTGSTWPGSPGAASTTTSAYDGPSGLLSSKTFTDSTAITFQYNTKRLVSRRTWTRTGNPYANYAYDSNTGELTGIDYSDSTPDVTYASTRAGQLKTVTDATGSRTFDYDSSNPWRLAHEKLPSYFGSRWLSPQYEASGMVGRIAGFQLGTSSDYDADLKQDWQYEAGTGRFDKVLAATLGGSARTFDYGYVASSSLLGPLDVTNPGAGSVAFSVARTYDARDLLTDIQASWSTTPVARFEYGYTTRGQRDWEKRSGTSFALDNLKVTVDFQYNDRGELTKALAYRGETMVAPERMPNLQHEYGYDNAGNRTSANQTADSGRVDSFTINDLNQVTGRDNKSVIASGTVGGTAGVAVSVNGGTPVDADRQGSYWSKAFTPANSGHPDSAEFSVVTGAGTGVFTSTGTSPSPTAYVGPLAQSISRDADGNTTGDENWTYDWDGENRLIRATATSAAVTAGFPNKKLEFQYDYAGRRVQKAVYTWSGSAWGLDSARRFIYDGWNVIAEYDAPSGTSIGDLKRSYAWGLDLAGSLSATGGVGALLQITDHTISKTYLPAYDGNGNLMALYDADGSGTAAVVYEYSPFGETLRAEIDSSLGSTVRDALATQPFRFSTKFTDTETGLVYYGHRYYSASLGRFINRDPIGEAGGLNLYAFASNDPINGIDVLGLNDEWRSRRWDPFHSFDWLIPASYDFNFGGGSTYDYLYEAALREEREYLDRQRRVESQKNLDFNASVGRELQKRLVYTPRRMEFNANSPTGSEAGKAPKSVFPSASSLRTLFGSPPTIQDIENEQQNLANTSDWARRIGSRDFEAYLNGKIAYLEGVKVLLRDPLSSEEIAEIIRLTAIGRQFREASLLGKVGLFILHDPLAQLALFEGAGRLQGVVSPVETRPLVVNEQTIRAALEGSTMKTTQGAVSIPVVERYVRLLEAGSEAPAIRGSEGVLVEGNHRYIARRVFGQEPLIEPGNLPSFKKDLIKPIQKISLDPTDWGNH